MNMSLTMWKCLISVLFIALGCVEADTLYRQRFCDCHGCDNTIVLECSIFGGGATIWQGTLFNQCQNHENIVLRHSQFNNITGTAINYTCDGNISISAHAVDVNESTYTSRLTVVFSEDLSGTTVECANQSKSIIGSYGISMEPDVAPPPTGLSLTDISENQLTFSWAFNKWSQQYIIDSSNCGVCPNTSTTNYTKCHSYVTTTDAIVCSLTIQSITLCGGIGRRSEPLKVKIKVPQHPTIQQSQVFDSVILTTLLLNENDLNNIRNYTITFTDSTSSAAVCVPMTVSTSSCVRSVCSAMFDISSLPCIIHSNIINVSVFATSAFGSGPASRPFTVSLLHDTGSIECEYAPEMNMKFDFIASVIFGSLMTLTVIVSVITTTILVICRMRVQKELNKIRDHKVKHTYEEVKSVITSNSAAAIATEGNAAYSCMSKVCGRQHT